MSRSSIQELSMRWVPLLLWCALIFFLSAQPHLPGPENVTMDFFFKKLGHVCAYAMLFFLTYRALGRTSNQRVMKAVIFCILYAVSDEYHQSFVPGRTPMLRDIGIDILGISLGYFYVRRHH